MKRRATIAFALVASCAWPCARLEAQFAGAEPRFEVSAGPSWTGSASYGTRDATLTTANGDRFSLFSTSSDLAAATGVEVHVGSRVTRLFRAEIAGSYSAPRLETSVGGDTEGAASAIASEGVKQFVVEGAGILLLPRLRLGSRGLPFVRAGAGYVRQLHDGNVLVETGPTYQVGGGAKISLTTAQRSQKKVKQIGLRVDGRACIRTGGVALDGHAHTVPQFSAALFVGF
jgi:hypothetical protein